MATAGVLVLPMTALEAVNGPSDPRAEQTESEHEVAQIKIEIKLESGRVVKPDDHFTVDYGVENALEIEAEGSSHQFKLKVDRKGGKAKKKKVVSLTIGYDRDGEAIVAPYTFDAELKKREVVRIEGGMALALTVVSKKAAGQAPPRESPQEPVKPDKDPSRKKLDLCEEDDPLCGV